MKHTSSDNIAEALNLLEEAAGQKQAELKGLMSDKYNNLKSLIMETETSLMTSLTQAKDASAAKACEITHDVDRNVHQNPWSYIAGAAVVGLLLGTLLQRDSK